MVTRRTDGRTATVTPPGPAKVYGRRVGVAREWAESGAANGSPIETLPCYAEEVGSPKGRRRRPELTTDIWLVTFFMH